jgi:hypothetical protein
MGAATVTKFLSNQYTPGQEIVILQATRGDTYSARTLGAVDAALISFYEDNAAITATPGVSVSGNTVTIRGNAAFTNSAVVLVLYGA